MQLTAGTPVASGRYVVEDLLGQGGMAAVYRVRHAQLGTPLALKVLTSASPDQRDRLMREGRAQAALRHTNIVSVVDVVQIDGLAALVMEFIDGPDLAYVLKRRSLTPEQADDLMRGILAGVAAAHDQGFVHRDLKPGNILLAAQRSRPVPRVADFGLVKQLAEGAERATRTGAMMGTPAYMAPEQVRDAGKVDARADVFALGAIAYELFSGRRAFDGDDAFEIFEAIVRGQHTPLSEAAPSLSPRLAAVIERALTTDPDARFADAGAMEAAWLAEAPALSASSLWAGDALVSGAGIQRAPVPSASETFSVDAVQDLTAEAPSAPTLDAAPASQAEPRAGASSRRGLWGPVAVGVVAVALAVGWMGRGPSAPTVFTVEAAPVVYAEADKQRMLEQAWLAAVRGDVSEARFGLDQLVDDAQVPAEVVALSLTIVNRLDGTGLVQKVPFEEKAETTGTALCVRGMEGFQAALAEGTEEAKRERMAAQRGITDQMHAWLDQHPDDLLTALCLYPLSMGDWSRWPERVERADPDATSPWATEGLVWMQMDDPDAALALLTRARAASPGSVRLISLEAEVHSRAGDYATALPLLEQALERDPTDLEVRSFAARAAAQAGDEAALRRHLGLVMVGEWPEDARAQALGDVLNHLLGVGRPTLALEQLGRLEYPASLPGFYSGFMMHRLVHWPGLFTPEQREEVAAMYRRGLGPGAHGGFAQTLDRHRTLADVAVLVARGEAAPSVDDARYGPEAHALFAAGAGDPQALLALAEEEYARTPNAWAGRLSQACLRDFRKAGAYHLAGQVDRALGQYEALLEDYAEVSDGSVTSRRAFAAGHLALAAFERGEADAAAPYVALYQDLWPIAEDTMPLAVALAEYGVVTGPRRAAWEAEQAE